MELNKLFENMQLEINPVGQTFPFRWEKKSLIAQLLLVFFFF